MSQPPSRTIPIHGTPATFVVLPVEKFDPARTGGWVQMTRAGEVRTIYLDLGRLPLDQENFDAMDDELLSGWWEKAG